MYGERLDSKTLMEVAVDSYGRAEDLRQIINELRNEWWGIVRKG